MLNIVLAYANYFRSRCFNEIKIRFGHQNKIITQKVENLDIQKLLQEINEERRGQVDYDPQNRRKYLKKHDHIEENMYIIQLNQNCYKLKEVSTMGCCQPTKVHIRSNGDAVTRNATKYQYDANIENQIRSRSSLDKRKGRGGGYSINEYDNIMGDAYRNQYGDYTIQMKDLEDLPIYQVSTGQQIYKLENETDASKSASQITPAAIHTVLASKKGKKSYQSTYPRI